MTGTALADARRAALADRLEAVRARGGSPRLATVLASEAPADVRFVELKHEACAALGIESEDVRIDPEAEPSDLYEAVASLSGDVSVDAVFVQVPLPDGVELPVLRDRINPAKDVDCFHPESLGRLVRGDPRFVPATVDAVHSLLEAYEVPTEGADAVVVGRSSVIGLPIAHRLLWDGPGGNATVTVCHSRTADLAAKTRRADLVVTACGEPELIDGNMLAPGATVVDVSANRVRQPDGGVAVVGDVAYESAAEVAGAITPVPGGVGPITLVALLENVVTAADRRLDS